MSVATEPVSEQRREEDRLLSRRVLGWPLGRWLLLALLLLPVPGALALENLAIDPVRYFSMARRFAETGVYGREIKERFIDDTPIVLDGPTEFPPLFPMVSSLALRFHGGLRAVQVLNALLVMAALVLLFRLTRGWFGQAAALLTIALWTAWDFSFWLSTMGFTEALALFVTALVLTATVRAPPGVLPAVWIGTLVALAYLVRPELVLLAGGAAAYRVHAAGAGRRLAAVAREAVPLLVTAGGLALGLQRQQDVTYPDRHTSQAFLFNVGTDAGIDKTAETAEPEPQGLVRRLLLRLPTPVQALFDPGFRAWLLWRMKSKIEIYAGQLMLLLGVPLTFVFGHGLVRLARRRSLGVHWGPTLLLGLAALPLFLVPLALWLPPSERYLATTLFLVLPLVAGGTVAALTAARGILRPVFTGLLALTLGFGLARTTYRSLKALNLSRTMPAAYFLTREPTEWTDPDAAAAARRLAAELPPDGAIGAVNPWLFNLLTGLPATGIPREPDETDVARGRSLPLRAWVDSPYHDEPPEWPAPGTRVERAGRFRVHICGSDGCAGSAPAP